MAKYTPSTFQSGDFVTVQRMNELSSNDQFLYDNLIDARYSAYNVKRDTGIKILAGNIVLPAAPTRDYVRGAVQFGGFFTPGSYPIVNATPLTNQNQRVSVAVSGFNQLDVTSTGFVITVTQFETARPNRMLTPLRVNYIVFGY